MSSTISIGDVVWVRTGEHRVKTRPAVVLSVLGDSGGTLYRIILATGTNRPPAVARVRVRRGSREARCMKLSKTSFFYGGDVAVVTVEALELRAPRGYAPGLLVQELEALLDD